MLAGMVNVSSAQEALTFLPPLRPDGKVVDRPQELTGKSLPVNNRPMTKIVETTQSSMADPIQEKQERYNTLQQQVESLSEYWKRMQSQQNQLLQLPQDSSITHDTGPSIEAPSPGSSPPQDAADPMKSVQQQPTVSPPVPGDSSNSFPETTVDKNVTESAETKSLPQDIDRFGLASSLFATHHHAQCLQVILALDVSTLRSDQLVWLEYMKAGCHRNQGNVAEAQRYYRRVVASPEGGWMSDLSRWWLDHLLEREELISKSQQLTTVLKQWEVEVDALELNTK